MFPTVTDATIRLLFLLQHRFSREQSEACIEREHILVAGSHGNNDLLRTLSGKPVECCLYKPAADPPAAITFADIHGIDLPDPFRAEAS